MRERLINLVGKARKTAIAKGTNSDIERNMIFADYLLDNGVIVPPCKVGDKIYRIVGDGSIFAWDVVSMKCYVDEIGFEDDSDNWIVFDDIGKTVFLTKEEAEKALKGGAE